MSRFFYNNSCKQCHFNQYKSIEYKKKKWASKIMEATLQPPLREEGSQTTFPFNGHAPKIVSGAFYFII